MIKVLIVDDSPSARAALTYFISSDHDLRVVGTASNGVDALTAVEALKPDVITMDIHMPRMDGPTAIRQIMQTHPTPIVVVTGNEITEEIRATFKSLESGALAIVARPAQLDQLETAEVRQLLEVLKLMAEVKVVRRWGRTRDGTVPRLEITHVVKRETRIVAIGASTGGPSALKTILSGLPAHFAVPIVIVQHIAKGFTTGFADWLNEGNPLTVKVAAADDVLQAGLVYLAPEGFQIGVNSAAQVALRTDPQSTLVPSVNFLFESVARSFGPQATGVLLTGMGRDGASGLLSLRRAGGLTIAQDKETSIVHGMPGEAITLGAAEFVLPPEKIAELLINAVAAEKSL